jgi:hypothetical protein
MFKPGQRVVCVNDDFQPALQEWFDLFPAKGRIYTAEPKG